jgi:hypothetical protein
LAAATDWHAAVVDVYRSEIGGSLNILGEPDPEYHDALIQALDRLLARVAERMDRFFDVMLRSKHTLDRVGESHGNTREMYRSFVVGEPSTKHTYLNVCLMYLILCEGLFGPQARFLLSVDSLSEDGDTYSVLTDKIKPLVLAERLAASGLGAFADGYHRHIRNSVAHGHFRFDQKRQSMRFRDYKPDSEMLVLMRYGLSSKWRGCSLSWMTRIS